ncbi:ribose ABC transporter permease [Agathobaculum sp. NTUH-O15-33]|uniref:ABC transporter permease n=1 Tax=Agathobaculum sp. NTUH-O15-33 TaxID=3079302 RepID=UPI002958D4CA|nr:ribose ABC transporter permease [Agathobaculum sp. NTUH-O15-33]WNX86250.1 ribose ABC transporter permease [Agathobaculum sp. NTUH-O15-33]
MKQNTAGAEKKSALKRLFEIREFGVICALIIMVLLLSVFAESFFSASNFLTILRTVSTNGIIAVGVTFVILTGGIDLSVGSGLALCGAFAAATFNGTGSSVLAAVVALVTGLILGLFNGVLIAFFDVPPFIQTLVTMTAARGIVYIFCDGTPIPEVGAFIGGIGRGRVLGIPNPVILTVIVFAVGWFLLNKTTLGRYVYAIGGNEECTKLSGVNVRRYKMMPYIISGVTSALACLILIGRLNSAQPSMGDKFEMDAIAAVVVGGTSLSGGSGTMVGTLVGALIIGVLMNGMNMLGVDSYAQYIVKGAVILFAVLLETRKNKNSK